MIIDIEKIPAFPEAATSFLTDLGLVPIEYHYLTVAPWGVELPIDRDRVRSTITFLDEFYLVEKHYQKSSHIQEDHTRMSLVRAVSSPYLEEIYESAPRYKRFLHVTTHVGVLPAHCLCQSWKHGIGIQSLKDKGLEVHRINLFMEVSPCQP